MRIGAISGASPVDKFISMPDDWLVKAGSGSDAALGGDAATTTGAAHRKAIIAEESNLSGSDTAKETGSTGKTEGADLNPGESKKVNPGRKSSPAECKTCKERKYQDGSNLFRSGFLDCTDNHCKVSHLSRLKGLLMRNRRWHCWNRRHRR